MSPRDANTPSPTKNSTNDEAHQRFIHDKEELVAEHRIAERGLTPNIEKSEDKSTDFKLELKWLNIVVITSWYIGSLYALQLMIEGQVQCKTMALAYVLYVCSGLGITAGAHRLWSHRAYKAKWPMRLILAIFNSVAFQNSIYDWSRDHRVHHKFTETNADPHNVKRGFFFAHVGWLMSKKHPEVKAKGQLIDFSDLWADPIVRYQHQYYVPLMITFCFILPTMAPHYLWGETLWNSFFVCAIFRYCFLLNATWLVNSAAHLWGRRPYDKHIYSAENRFVSTFAFGEGFHNYHHTFPWDYATSELGYDLNFSKIFIDAFEKIGWAYDLRRVTPEQIVSRKHRTGDVAEKGAYGPHN